MKNRYAQAFALWLLLSPCVFAADPVKPPPPPTTIPDIRSAKVAVLCVDCDQPFDGPTHKRVLEGLVSNSYVGELRRALYLQDSLHQFESKVHFDNCDFDDAIRYADERLVEAGGYADEGAKAKARGDTAAMQGQVRKAFFALGQALHGVQDFYAHSNYVELSVPNVKRVTDLELVSVWRPEGKARIKKLREAGLVSGFVFWGFPQRCATRSPSHGDLAKDSETTTSGKVRVVHLQNISQYGVAVYLAREDSVALLRDAFKRWPLLKDVNGPDVALDVIVDRRQ